MVQPQSLSRSPKLTARGLSEPAPTARYIQIRFTPAAAQSATKASVTEGGVIIRRVSAAGVTAEIEGTQDWPSMAAQCGFTGITS